jgi:hypothetical protein
MSAAPDHALPGSGEGESVGRWHLPQAGASSSDERPVLDQPDISGISLAIRTRCRMHSGASGGLNEMPMPMPITVHCRTNHMLGA